MIRRILDFVFILLFFWTSMLFGLWIIHTVIVPMEIHNVTNNVLTGIVKVSISASLVLIWLWFWREIVKKMFWRTLKNNNTIKQSLQKEKQKCRDKVSLTGL